MKLHLVIAMGVALVAPALGSLREAAAQTQQNRKLMPKLPPDAPQDWARMVGWNEKLIKLHGRKLIIKFGSFETPGSITLDGRVLFKANQGDLLWKRTGHPA